MENERETALGKREALKHSLRKTMLKAGIFVSEIHDVTNPILGEDFLSMDLTRAKIVMDELVILQRSAKAAKDKISLINKTYNFEDESE